MKKFFLLFLLLNASASAQTTDANIVNLCSKNEFVLLSAKLNKLTQKEKNQDFLENKTGKYVSLCASSAQEPYEVIHYRFGKPGAVELEKKFDKNNRIELYPNIDHPITYNTMRFEVGKYNYLINRGTGGMSIVSLIVKKNNKELAYFIARYEDIYAPIDDFFESLNKGNINKKLASSAYKEEKFDY